MTNDTNPVFSPLWRTRYPVAVEFAIGLSFLLLLLAADCARANDVDAVLRSEEPSGVVFELIGDSDLLERQLPELRRNIERLRSKFPGLSIAIVSHGSEQFSLTRDNRTRRGEVHNQVETLVSEGEIDVHVCGTHAGWYDVAPEDFPDYVDVAPSGPARINDYLELGYELIVIN